MLRRAAVPMACVLVALTACSSETPSDEPSPDRCADAVDGWQDATAAADAAIADLEDIIASGSVTMAGSQSGYELLFADPAQWTVPSGTDPADIGWESTQTEALRQVRIAARVVQDNESCFDPAEVAAAEDLLDQLP